MKTVRKVRRKDQNDKMNKLGNVNVTVKKFEKSYNLTMLGWGGRPCQTGN